MSNKPTVQKSKEIFPTQTKRGGEKQPHGGVRQDNIALTRDRADSLQPASAKNPPRSRPKNKETNRTQKQPVAKKRTVCLSLWVDPGIKLLLKQQAQNNGLSISATGAALLERAMQTETDMAYGALLKPAITEAITRGMHAYSSRLATLLVQTLYATEHTKNLVTNVLARQPDVKREDLETILTASENSARNKIAVKDPRLVGVIEQVKTWLREALTEQKRKN